MQQQDKWVSKIADIGELDHRIALMKKEYVGENPNTGTSMYKDVRLGDVWAKVSVLRGQEYYTAVTVKLEKQLSFIIRYRDDVDEETNTRPEGRGYNTGFIDDVKHNHKYPETRAEYSRGVDDPNEDS